MRELFITPVEAVKLVDEISIASDAKVAEAICLEYYKSDISDGFGFNWMLAAVWNAGRVQGIREERNKKHRGAVI